MVSAGTAKLILIFAFVAFGLVCLIDNQCTRTRATAQKIRKPPTIHVMSNESSSTSAIMIPRSEVERHSSRQDFWVVIEGYVVDLTSFLDSHPGEGTIRRILSKRYKGIDITPNFIDHFDHTVAAFRRACQSFDNQSQPITFSFREVTNKNVTVLGKLEV